MEAPTISRTIARNSFWYGLETGIGLVSGVVTSIIIARALGPATLGHYTYIAWLVNITVSIGGLGIPAATYKYMAEHLGRGELSAARSIFFATLRVQVLMATVLTIGAIGVAWFGTGLEMRWTGVILAAAMWPAMVIAIPSHANMANENLSANVPAALVSNVLYVIGVVLTLTLSAGTIGLAATLLGMRMVELGIRITPVWRWMKSIPPGALHSLARHKFINFSRQSTMLLLLSIVVWDRSEVLLLRYFSGINQLAFYTVVFNVTERLRVLPETFGAAASATMMAQFGRNPASMGNLTSAAIRYLALLSTPIYVGVAVLSSPIIHLTYGAKYLDVIPLLTAGALLALPRVFLTPISSLLAAADKQSLSLRGHLAVAVLNIALDFALIPRYGAMGAVFANGLAQIAAVLVLGWLAGRTVSFRWPIGAIARIASVGLAMSLAVLFLPRTSYMAMDVLLGLGVGAVVYFTGIRLSGALEWQDKRRLLQLSTKLPMPVRRQYTGFVEFLIPGLQPQVVQS